MTLVAASGTLALWAASFVPLPPASGTHVLEVVATGERAPASHGTEVWVLGLLRDGVALAASDWRPQGDWDRRADGTWISHGSQPATLRWRGATENGLRLTLLAHGWSGVALVRWEGVERRMDLFRLGGGPLEIDLPNAPPGPRTVALRWLERLLRVLLAVPLTLLLCAAGLWVGDAAPAPAVRRPGVGWLVGLPSLLTGAAALLAFWPAVLSPDSVDQWRQALTGSFSDYHPIFHTVALRWLQAVAPTPALPAALQVVALAALAGWTGRVLRGAGVAAPALAAAALLTALDPVHLTMAVTLWKDVPYGLSVVALTVLVFQGALEPERLQRRAYWFALGLLGTCATLLRHNGMPALLGAITGAWLLAPRNWRRPAVTLAASLLLGATAHQALVRYYRAEPVPWAMAFVGILGAHVAAATPLDADERRLLESLHPLEGEGWHYDCYTNVPTMFDGHFDGKALAREGGRTAGLAFALTWRRPLVTLRHLACASSLLWRMAREDAPLAGPAIGRDPGGRPATIAPLVGAPAAASRAPALEERLVSLLEWSEADAVEWIFWRPALFLYFCCLAALLAGLRRRSPRPALALLPLLLHTAALALVIPSQDQRYEWPAVLVATLLAPGWLAIPGPEVSAPPGNQSAA